MAESLGMKNLIPKTTTLVLLFAVIFSTNANAQSCMQKYGSDEIEMYQCDNLKFIRVRGSPVQRMQELGLLHKKKLVSNETLDYFANSVEKQAGKNPTLRSFARSMYNLWVGIHDNQIPQSMKKEIKAFINSSGYSKSKYYRAMLLPDMATASISFDGPGTNNTNYGFGCSSFSEVESSHMAFGRNLDFPGIHVYDKNPTITVHLPEAHSKEIAHVALTSDGLYFSSISGFNKEGVFLVVHQNFSKDHSTLRGLPLYLVGETVLRSAHSLEEALILLKKNRPLGMWTFVVGSLKDKRIATVESSATRFSYKISTENTYAQANHLRFTPDRDKIELLGAGDRYNSTYRIAKGLEILNGTGDSLEKVYRALSFQEHADGSLNSVHDILKAETIHSFMLSAEHSIESANLYMAIDGAPAASGRFLQFKWENIWTENPEYQTFSDELSLSKRTIQSEMVEAHYQLDERGDYLKALSIMQPQQTYSALALKSSLYYTLKNYDQAQEELNSAIQSQWQAIPRHMKESFWAMNALLAHKKGKYRTADKLIKMFFQLKPKNGDLVSLMRSIKRYNDFARLTGIASEYLLKKFTVSYDFFSGDLLLAEGF